MAQAAALILAPGLESAMPSDNTALTEGRIYPTTDTHKLYRDNGTSWDELQVGSSGGGGSAYPYVCVKDVKSANTNGGSLPGDGSFHKRDVNTEVEDTGGNCSLSNNQITLAAGTWRASIHFFQVCGGTGKGILHDTTGNADLIIGDSVYANSTPDEQVNIWLIGKFTLSVQSVLEIQHRSNSSTATYGYGVASNMGKDEVYLTAEFWKIE